MPVRVLCVGSMYPPHHLGGYELVWQAAVEHLRERGHEVAVLTTEDRRPGVLEQSEPGIHRELRWWWRDHGCPRRTPRERLTLERHNAEAFDRLAAGFRPDAVTWWAMGGMSLSLIARAGRLSLPAAGFVHDDWLLYGPNADQWTRMFRRAPATVAAAVEQRTGIPTRFEPEVVDGWWFVSESTHSRALATGLPLKRTEIAPSGIAITFRGSDPSQDLCKRWEGRLLYVGRVDERKGTATAVEALASLPEDVTLTIAGDGDAGHLAELRRLMDRFALNGRVRIEPGRPRGELP